MDGVYWGMVVVWFFVCEFFGDIDIIGNDQICIYEGILGEVIVYYLRRMFFFCFLVICVMFLCVQL